MGYSTELYVLFNIFLLSTVKGDITEQDWFNEGHLKPFGRQGPTISMEVVNGFVPPAEFFTKYVENNNAVVMRGAIKDTDAFKNWHDSYLKSVVPPRPTGDIFVELMKKENRTEGSGDFYGMDQFFEEYNSTKVYMVNEVPRWLWHDVSLPFSLQCKELVNGGLDTQVMWFSSGGTSSVIHQDYYENLNCLYRGKKKLVLVDVRKYPKIGEMIIDTDDGAFANVDPDRIDLNERPYYKGIEYIHLEINAGDCLYIPFKWIHQIRSYGSNMAVNVWWYKKSMGEMTCRKTFAKDLTFDKVKFSDITKRLANTVKGMRKYLIEYLQQKGQTSMGVSEMTELMANDQEKVKDDKKFKDVVSQLFEKLDFDKNKQLSKTELKQKISYSFSHIIHTTQTWM